NLPPAGPPAGPVDATGADPAAARALVEAFESGVRRAELSRSATGFAPAEPDSAPAGPGTATVDLDFTPARHAAGAAGPTPTATRPDGTPGRPRLTRRVPGANLTISPPRQPASQHLGDPNEVRNLLTAFEAGVARALREVSPDRNNEEGSSR
ncbi:histidine kinase, partial [Micromonospora phytophila]|nr:histidine kinase [Micromonospora phytophila]